MNAPVPFAQHTAYLADTHEVINVSRELADYNMYTQDTGADGGGRGVKAPPGRTTISPRSAGSPGRPSTWTSARRPTASGPSWKRTTASATASTWCGSIRPITRS